MNGWMKKKLMSRGLTEGWKNRQIEVRMNGGMEECIEIRMVYFQISPADSIDEQAFYMRLNKHNQSQRMKRFHDNRFKPR